MPTLLVTYSDGPMTIPLPEGKPLYVGRDPACDIVASSPLVSRRHAVIINKNGVSGIKDLGSNNGTIVNGQKLAGTRRLLHGDVVTLHGLTIRYAENIRKRDKVGPGAPAPSPGNGEQPRIGETDTQYLPPPTRLAALFTDEPVRQPAGEKTIRIEKEEPDGDATWRSATDAGNVLAPREAPPEPLRSEPPGEAERPPAPPDAPDDPLPPAVPDLPPVFWKTAPRGDGIEELPVTPGLQRAMIKRFRLFEKLDELVEERRLLRLGSRELPREVESELLRQDGELENIPTPEQADSLADEFAEKWAGAQRVAPEMRKARELAREQWRLCRESNRAQLPKVCWEAYQIVADEELASELCDADIFHADLLGMAAYRIALEPILAAAREEKERLRGAPGTEDASGDPAERERQAAAWAAALSRETAYLQRRLEESFWRVFADAAARFLPSPDPLSTPMRAFLRYGVLGFGPWWMRDNIRRFLAADCSGDVLESVPRNLNTTPVLYADEYLAAVLDMECPPYAEDAPREAAPEEDRDGVAAARAWKKLSTVRSYRRLLADLLPELGRQVGSFDHFNGELDARIRAAETGAGDRSEAYELLRKKQSLAARQEFLIRNMEVIEEVINGDLLRMEREGEERFRAGDFVRPKADVIIRNECDAMRELSRKLAGFKPAFLPMAIRDGFLSEPGDVADRAFIAARIEEVETLDAGLFKKTVIRSKRRKHQVHVRLCPVVVILPFVGASGFCRRGREGMDGGLLFVPVRFDVPSQSSQAVVQLLADYRWETSLGEVGFDAIGSDTLAGQFMKVRWDWRSSSRERRERGLIFSDMSDKLNWRKVYEVYLQDADQGAERLFNRNPELYAALVGSHLELPEGVPPLRKAGTEIERRRP